MTLDYGDRVDGPDGAGAAASLTPMADRDGRLHPRNPFVGLFLAVLMLLIAAAGLLAVALEPDLLVASGNRRAGLLIIGPLFALVAGVFTLVRGFLAIGPWAAHRTTPLALRRQERAADLQRRSTRLLVIVGTAALAGFVTLIVVFGSIEPSSVDLAGRLVQLEILAFLALLWIACFGLVVQKRFYARFYVGRDPRNELPRA